MPSCEVVGSIFLAGDHLFGVVELTVHAGAYLVNHRRLQVHEDGSRHVTSRSRLAKSSGAKCHNKKADEHVSKLVEHSDNPASALRSPEKRVIRVLGNAQ